MSKMGTKEETAKKIWALIEKASGYLFNRSHAVSYSVTSYQTAWLKAHYPLEFFTACMNIDKIPEEKLKKLIEEAYALGIKIKRPDIMKSKEYCTIEKKAIRLGLTMVKFVGYTTAHNIVLARERDGKKGIHGLPKRVMSSRVVASLRDVGAFGPKYLNPQAQYELLGFILDSPIDEYEKKITKRTWSDGETIQFGGLVDLVKTRKTKKGTPMMHVDISRAGSAKTLVLFERHIQDWGGDLKRGNVVVVTARKQSNYDTYIPQKVEVLN